MFMDPLYLKQMIIPPVAMPWGTKATKQIELFFLADIGKGATVTSVLSVQEWADDKLVSEGGIFCLLSIPPLSGKSRKNNMTRLV